MDLPPLEPLLYAFAAATVVLAAGWRPWSRGARPAGGPWASALLLPLVLAAAWYGTSDELAPYPPREAKDWAFYGVLAGALLALVERWWPALALAAVGLSAALFQRALQNVLTYEFGAEAVVYHVAGLAVAAGATALALRRGARAEGRAAAGHAWLWLAAFALAGTIQRGTWGGGGLLLGGACCGLGGVAVLALLRPGWHVTRGLAGAGAMYLVAVLAIGHYSAETPRGATLAALALPQLAWVAGRGWQRGLALAVLLAALGGYAIWDSWPEPDPYAGYY